MKQKSIESKVHSHLAKDINRIRKTAEAQMKMNLLRKHQIKLLNEFIEKLIKEKRISKEELIPYTPKRKMQKKNCLRKFNLS